MFEIVIGLFREFSPLTILLIVFVVLILLGSIVIEYKDGQFKFSYRWSGLKKGRRRNNTEGNTEDKNTEIIFRIISALFLRLIAGSSKIL
jgi:hypothetical protein